MKPYRATLRLLYDYDRALVDVIQFLDSHKHSNQPIRETVDKLLNHSDDLKKAVTDAKSGQAEIRNDKDGNIGVSIGKKSFSDEKLTKNFNAILETLEKEKSNNTIKGDLIRSAFITSTMGVSYKLKLGKSI